MKSPRLLAPFVFICLCSHPAWAEVQLPAIFSDHAVLQQDVSVPIWGWAAPGEKITVSFAGQTKSSEAAADGKWKVQLDKLAASHQPQTLTVQGQNTLAVQDVLVGEVWLCSGQSNMGMTVNRAQDFDREKAAATLPEVRTFHEVSPAAKTPQEKCRGQWEICSPETVGTFSATAYFFGREVYKALGRPVGLVNSSVGGTAVEAWTSLEAQAKVPELKPVFERWSKLQAEWKPAEAQAMYEKQLAAWKKAKADGKPTRRPPRKPEEPQLDRNHPSNLFNGKIAPLIPYAIRGAIWYQGENNANRDGSLYGWQLPTLINDWRTRWGQGDFPFAWVQLPNFRAPQKEPVEENGWSDVREGMLKTLSLSNTGMAIAIDVGEADNIHPKNKQEVGRRLALWAQAKVYGQPGAASGPIPSGHTIEGGTIILSFNHADGGLVSKGGPLKGFAIAGSDGKWVKADARIDGQRVIVSSPAVAQPVAVRYAWASNPDCNLYNATGLPASPFRTDAGKPAP